MEVQNRTATTTTQRLCGVCGESIDSMSNMIPLNKDHYFGVRYAHPNCFYCSVCGRQLDPGMYRSYNVEQKDPSAHVSILCSTCHLAPPTIVVGSPQRMMHHQSPNSNLNKVQQPISPNNHLLSSFVDHNQRVKRSLFNEQPKSDEYNYDDKTRIILNKVQETKVLAGRFLDKNHLLPGDGISRTLETLKSENDYLKTRLIATEKRVEEAERYSNQLYETNKVIDFNLSSLGEYVIELVSTINTERSRLDQLKSESNKTKKELDETMLKLSNLEIQKSNFNESYYSQQIDLRDQEIKMLRQELTNEKKRMERMELSTKETFKQVQEQSNSYELEIKKLQDQQKAHKKSKECTICMDNEPNVVIMPCGHVPSCRNCSVQLTTCPICRGRIETKYVIFPN